jgi:WD40 repeat protein
VLIFKPHSKPIYAVVFSPDGRYLATSSCDKTVVVTDLSVPSVMRQLPGSEFRCPLAFSPNGKFLARGGCDGVKVWDWADPSPSAVFSSENTPLGALAFSPDGCTLAALGGPELRQWTVPSGKPITGQWGVSPVRYRGLTGCLAYAPDGSVLATTHTFGSGPGSYERVAYLREARSGTVQGQLVFEGVSVPTAIAFSRDGKLLAGICGPVMNVFDVATRERLAVVKPGKKHFKGLTFTPDGRLVTVSNDQTVRMWEPCTLKQLRAYEWKIGKLGAVAVALDGQRMAAGGDTGRVVVWDADD